MAYKVSVKAIITIFLLCGLLSACMDPVDLLTFMDDPQVVELIDAAQGNVVKLDDRTGDGLRGGNEKITGLKNNKYYMVEKELDKDGNLVYGEGGVPIYPAFVTDLAGVGPGGLNGLDSITRISGGIIKGWSNGLNNRSTYTVRAAAPVSNGLIFSVDSNDVYTSNGVLNILNSAADISIEINNPFIGYEVMGVKSPDFKSPSNAFNDGKKIISNSTRIQQKKDENEVDYIFYKPDAPENFFVLKVKIGAVPPTVITDKAILGVTAPVAGETAAMVITNTDQYTGSVTWSPSLSDGKFAPQNTYTATITLTAKAGYTFEGVSADFFTVAGTSPAATNPAGSGTTCIVTAKFPATPAPGTGNANFTITFTINDAMDGKLTADSSYTIDRGTFNGANKVILKLAAPGSGSWSGIKWYVGGAEDTAHVTDGGSKLTIDNSSAFWPLLAQDKFEVSVTATLNEAPYSGTVTITVTGP